MILSPTNITGKSIGYSVKTLEEFSMSTWEATNEHSIIPASPCNPRKHVSANLAAAKAWISEILFISNQISEFSDEFSSECMLRKNSTNHWQRRRTGTSFRLNKRTKSNFLITKHRWNGDYQTLCRLQQTLVVPFKPLDMRYSIQSETTK